MTKYPRTMKREEMISWIEKSGLPLRLYVRQLDKDQIIMTRISPKEYEALKKREGVK